MALQERDVTLFPSSDVADHLYCKPNTTGLPLSSVRVSNPSIPANVLDLGLHNVPARRTGVSVSAVSSKAGTCKSLLKRLPMSTDGGVPIPPLMSSRIGILFDTVQRPLSMIFISSCVVSRSCIGEQSARQRMRNKS